MKVIISSFAKTYIRTIPYSEKAVELFKYLNLICVIFYWGGDSIQKSTSCPLSTLDMTHKKNMHSYAKGPAI